MRALRSTTGARHCQDAYANRRSCASPREPRIRRAARSRRLAWTGPAWPGLSASSSAEAGTERHRDCRCFVGYSSLKQACFRAFAAPVPRSPQARLRGKRGPCWRSLSSRQRCRSWRSQRRRSATSTAGGASREGAGPLTTALPLRRERRHRARADRGFRSGRGCDICRPRRQTAPSMTEQPRWPPSPRCSSRRQAAVRAARQAPAEEPADRSRASPPVPMQIGDCDRRCASRAFGEFRVHSLGMMCEWWPRLSGGRARYRV
jgi:hypothetical protein